MRRLAGYFFALALAFAPAFAAAQTMMGGASGGATPGGVSGDVQTNNGSGGLNGVTVLTVPNGGTGLAAPTAHDVLVGAGASAVVPVTPGTSGWVLTSNGVGSDPSFQAAAGGGCTTACSYSDTQTIALIAALHSYMTMTGGSTTGAGTTGAVSLAWTLNTSGAVDVYNMTVTTTACTPSTQNLFRILYGATPTTAAFKVDCNANVQTDGNLLLAGQATVGQNALLGWTGEGIMTSQAVGEIRFGNLDGASPQAQTLKMQGVIAGTTNTAGAAAAIKGSVSTGTGVGGSVSIATSPAGSTGSAQNTVSNVLTVDGNQHVSFTSAAVPAITSCGTSPSAVVGSDAAGSFTTGTATPTACTMTFKVPYAVAPVCLTEDSTTRSNLTSYVVSTTTIVWTTAAASSQKIYYHCFGA